MTQTMKILTFFIILTLVASQDLVPDTLQYHLELVAKQSTPPNQCQYRLPTSVIPHTYNIKLVPYIVIDNFTFDGQVEIVVEAVEAVEKVTLHANKLSIDSEKITVKEVTESQEEVEVSGVLEDSECQLYTINLAKSLKVKSRYVINFAKFTGLLSDDLVGFYRSSYWTEDRTLKWLATTHFEATDARRAFPCFDEPALKASFTISVSRPEELRAISNMPQKGEPELDTEHTDVVRYWDHFEESPLMSTYTVAFVVSDFVYLDEKMRIFAPPHKVEYTRFALSHSKTTLDWLADYLNVSFDLPKMDQIAIPDFMSGAMENWGLVTYREEVLLLEDDTTPAIMEQFTTITIAHEFAHQWFGNLVTPEWWSYLWLSEGLATYFGSHAIAQMIPEWLLAEQFVVDVIQPALIFATTPVDHPLTVNDVSDPDEIRSIFDEISYLKAAAVIRMVESFVTPATFRKALQNYVKSRMYSTVNTEDLSDSMAAQMEEDKIVYDNVDFKEVMRGWTLQKGYPLINVTRDYGEDEGANLTQQHFAIKDQEVSTSKWYVPLTYTNQAEADFECTLPKHWLDPKNHELSTRITNLGDNSQWVLFNVKAAGFYRVNYDQQNWKLLTAFLKSKDFEVIPPVNRAQLIDDVFHLPYMRFIPYATALDLSTYLRQEGHFMPWRTADSWLNGLNFFVTGTREREVLFKFFRHLRNGGSGTLELSVSQDRDHVKRLTKAEAVKRACDFEEQECIDTAVKSVAQWIEQPANNSIYPDFREAFYCAAVRFGDSVVFTFLREQQQKCSVPWERSAIIKARGCSQDRDLLNSLLDEATDNSTTLTKSDRKTVFEAVYNRPLGLKVVFNYLAEHLHNVIKSFGSDKQVIKMIYKMATRSNDPEHAHQLERFLPLFSNEFGKYSSVIKKAIETIGDNDKWYETVGNEIIKWIEEYFKNLPPGNA